MLAQTLRTLERDGFVDRASAATIPPRVDYSLTQSSRDLTSQLLPLIDWIADHAQSIVEP
jgi:DNA-binding HxlR family transcriptional regulator